MSILDPYSLRGNSSNRDETIEDSYLGLNKPLFKYP